MKIPSILQKADSLGIGLVASDVKKTDEGKITIISYEEFQQNEYDMEYNPFDTTGTGYIDEDYKKQLSIYNKEAIDYYNKEQSIEYIDSLVEDEKIDYEDY